MKLIFFIYFFSILVLHLQHKALLHQTQLGPQVKFRHMLLSETGLVEGATSAQHGRAHQRVCGGKSVSVMGV